MLKRREEESENDSRMLRHKNTELERKLKEKEENPETTIALQKKIQELEKKLKETEQQKRGDVLCAAPDTGGTRSVQDEHENDVGGRILTASNLVTRPAIQMRGAESFCEPKGGMISGPGEKENQVTKMMMMMPFVNFKRGSKYSPPPKLTRVVRTTKPSVVVASAYAKGIGASRGRPSRDNVQGPPREKENKKKIRSLR